MDWSLRSCGRHGHATYAPDEPDLRAPLHTETPIGSAWRCLRCGDFVVGEPRGHGPAADAPEVIRGRALRDLVILRLLAVERLVRGLLVLLVAYGVFRFRDRRGTIGQAFNEDLPLIQNLADKLHWNFEDSSIVRAIHTFLNFKQSTLVLIAAGLAAYGLLQLIEATGLWFAKRWGEYFAVVATSLFIPIEVYEISEKISWLRILALVINVAAVVYLLLTKRLFGLRGGRAAYEAERHEANLLEVQEAATPERPGHHRRAEHVAAGRAAHQDTDDHDDEAAGGVDARQAGVTGAQPATVGAPAHGPHGSTQNTRDDLAPTPTSADPARFERSPD